MDRHNHFLPNDFGFQAPDDDDLAQVMPIAATPDPVVLANCERFLAGLRAWGMRVVAPNPVRYTDAIIAAILVQWSQREPPEPPEPPGPTNEDVVEVDLVDRI